MSVPNHRNENGEIPPESAMNDAIPADIMGKITQFVLDKHTGNIQLNIKDGEILGVHLEEIYTRKT